MARAIAIDAVLDAARGGHFTGRFGAFRIIACRRMPSRRDGHTVGVDLYVWFEGFLVACGVQSVRFDACAGERAGPDRARTARNPARCRRSFAGPQSFLRSHAIGVTVSREQVSRWPSRPDRCTSRIHRVRRGAQAGSTP
jgi:hypothetical protein